VALAVGGCERKDRSGWSGGLYAPEGLHPGD